MEPERSQNIFVKIFLSLFAVINAGAALVYLSLAIYNSCNELFCYNSLGSLVLGIGAVFNIWLAVLLFRRERRAIFGLWIIAFINLLFNLYGLGIGVVIAGFVGPIIISLGYIILRKPSE